MSVLVLLFGVVYPLVALAVMCVGVFGVAAGMPERHKAAERYDRASIYGSKEGYLFRHLTGLLALVVLAGALWPVSIPLWLAWRKGSFVADTVEKRQVIDRAVTR